MHCCSHWRAYRRWSRTSASAFWQGEGEIYQPPVPLMWSAKHHRRSETARRRLICCDPALPESGVAGRRSTPWLMRQTAALRGRRRVPSTAPSGGVGRAAVIVKSTAALMIDPDRKPRGQSAAAIEPWDLFGPTDGHEHYRLARRLEMV